MSKRDSIVICSISILALIAVFATTILPNVILKPKNEVFTPAFVLQWTMGDNEKDALPSNAIMKTIMINAYNSGELTSLDPKMATDTIKRKLCIAYADWVCPNREESTWIGAYNKYEAWLNTPTGN